MKEMRRSGRQGRGKNDESDESEKIAVKRNTNTRMGDSTLADVASAFFGSRINE
jgi:hypothetical protein